MLRRIGVIKEEGRSPIEGCERKPQFVPNIRGLGAGIPLISFDVPFQIVTVHLDFVGDSKRRLIFLCTLVWTIAGSV